MAIQAINALATEPQRTMPRKPGMQPGALPNTQPGQPKPPMQTIQPVNGPTMGINAVSALAPTSTPTSTSAQKMQTPTGGSTPPIIPGGPTQPLRPGAFPPKQPGNTGIVPSPSPGQQLPPQVQTPVSAPTVPAPSTPPPAPVAAPATGAKIAAPTAGTNAIAALANNTTQRTAPTTGAPVSFGDVGDFSTFSDQAFANAKKYLDPQIQQKRETFEQDMASRGIPVGSEAYNKAKAASESQISDQLSKASFDALQFGMNAQNQAFGQAATKAGFNQSEQARQFSQGMAGTQFESAEEQRQFQNNLAKSGFDQTELQRQFSNAMTGANFNQAEAQREFTNKMTQAGFTAQEAARMFQQGLAQGSFDLNEMTTLANTDLQYSDREFRDAQFNAQREQEAYNRLAALLGNAQVSGASPIDVLGAYGINTSANNAAYQGQMAQYGNNMAGLGNLASSAMMAYAMSTEAVKENIEPVSDETLHELVVNTPIYSFNYKPETGIAGLFVGPVIERGTPDEFLGPTGAEVNLYNMIGTLIGAVKHQAKVIDEQATLISSLSESIENLRFDVLG